MKAMIVLAGVSAMALASCGQPDPSYRNQNYAQGATSSYQPPLYASVNECITAGNQETLCVESFRQAADATPRFQSYAECEQNFPGGQCVDRGGWVGPALMGFMVGNMLANNNGYASNGYYRGGRYDYDYDYYRRDYNRPTTVYHNTTIYRDRQTSSTPAATTTRSATYGNPNRTPDYRKPAQTVTTTTTRPSTVASAPVKVAKPSPYGAPSAYNQRSTTYSSSYKPSTTASSSYSAPKPSYSAPKPSYSSGSSYKPSSSSSSSYRSSSSGSSSSTRSYSSSKPRY